MFAGNDFMKIIKNTMSVLALIALPYSSHAMSISLEEIAALLIPKVKTASVEAKAKKQITKLNVIATAYTSHVAQTDSTPNIAAWGDRLKPGMKAIAVSRDLLNHYGLKRGSKVRIKGLKGEYKVLDKMNKRWKKRIDIYMGKNISKAYRWGKRPVVIEWDKN